MGCIGQTDARVRSGSGRRCRAHRQAFTTRQSRLSGRPGGPRFPTSSGLQPPHGRSAVRGRAVVPATWPKPLLVANSRSLQPGQDLHRPDRAGLRFPGLSFRPGRAIRGQEDRREFRRPCDPALRARAGGGFRLRSARVVRATVGRVGAFREAGGHKTNKTLPLRYCVPITAGIRTDS